MFALEEIKDFFADILLHIERASRVRRPGANLFQQGSVVLIKLVLPVIRDFNTLRFLMTDKHSVRRLQSVPLSGNCEAISNGNAQRWLLYLENFIQKILMKMIFYQDIREYRKQSLRPNQTNESSRSKQFDPRFKRKDPVSNAIETVNEVKQKRAQGGCLGTKSRWKTW